ncbi:MAG: VCBS repeat-containing protein, partial [Acidobacteriia bacterium]|nr:VCBS repeat-containing protein [Terriglobia bacterium]
MLPSRGASLLVPLALLCQAANVPAQIRFRPATEDSGVDFTLRHAPTERKRMIETMAGGLAVFDFDGDGLQDIYFTNGAAGESMRKDFSEYSNRLFRNLGDMRFEDVTEAAGVAGSGYSMGVAAADFDNDGHADLFVAGVFQNTLYRNLGDGTFEDFPSRSGIPSGEWAVAAGWFPSDDDGRADLFVVNYADWTPDFDRYCGDRDRGLRVYCHPKYLTPIANRLYRNLGAGRFEPIGERVGLREFEGRGMSATFADFDANGRVDVFVTNDNLPNFLFLNQDDGRFTEDALLAGTALLDPGRPVASMGVDVGDYDNDGFADLSVTAL